MKYKFDWDDGNIAKIQLVKISGRIFGISEIESIFQDENKIFTESYPDVITGEARYQALGKSNKGTILVVTFVYRNEKIRVFNVWKAKQSKLKNYNEKIRNLEK